MSIYDIPGMEIWVQVMSTMPSPYPELAEQIYITSSWEEFDNITKYLLLKQMRALVPGRYLPCLPSLIPGDLFLTSFLF